MTELLPEVVTEMDKLRNLAPDLKKSKEEQKKVAGFIQQRKRAGLNTLFKTLQSLGFSYTSCSDRTSYTELFTHSDTTHSNTTHSDWGSSEKYFYRCFARFRQLQPLLDR